MDFMIILIIVHDRKSNYNILVKIEKKTVTVTWSCCKNPSWYLIMWSCHWPGLCYLIRELDHFTWSQSQVIYQNQAKHFLYVSPCESCRASNKSFLLCLFETFKWICVLWRLYAHSIDITSNFQNKDHQLHHCYFH